VYAIGGYGGSGSKG